MMISILTFFKAKPTFEQVFECWLRDRKSHLAPGTSSGIRSRFNLHVLPHLGNKLINKIKRQHLISILSMPKKPLTRKWLHQRLNSIYRYAVAAGYIEQNICETLKELLPQNARGSYQCLTEEKLPAFFHKIDKYPDRKKGAVADAILLCAYTATRRSEAALCRWDEFDFENRTWVINKSRMKMRREHTVFLSNQAIALLKKRKKLSKSTSERVFEVDPWTLSRAVNYADRNMTVHGLRKVFSSIAHDSGLWSIDAIELSLAHRIPGVRGIYNLAQYTEERRKLMQWYADKVDEWRGINV